ncbi:MAG: cupin domain-containing protein [Flavobacteriia bacterium]|jgi:quercetin dioxygenase-like cupin family protein
MNLVELHDQTKEVSASALFKGEIGSATAIQLLRNGTLKEHVTKTPALLVCVSGFVRYEDENDHEVELSPGDYFMITPNLRHWLNASVDSQLILFK